MSAGWAPRSISPWPAAIPGYGPQHLHAFTRCRRCPVDAHPATAMTWVFYGIWSFCLRHALEAEARALVAA